MARCTRRYIYVYARLWSREQRKPLAPGIRNVGSNIKTDRWNSGRKKKREQKGACAHASFESQRWISRRSEFFVRVTIELRKTNGQSIFATIRHVTLRKSFRRDTSLRRMILFTRYSTNEKTRTFERSISVRERLKAIAIRELLRAVNAV